ncbi:MAG: hypothetical protein ACRD08_01990, partial [Acidimicrobiales bacterium]
DGSTGTAGSAPAPAAAGEPGDTVSRPARPSVGDAGDDRFSPSALTCPGRLASGLEVTVAPPQPDAERPAHEAVVDALRLKGVALPAADHIETLGPAFETQALAAAASAQPLPASLPGGLTVQVAMHPGAADVLAGVTVARDERVVVVLELVELQPRYWVLDHLWACADEIAVREVVE